MKVMLLLPHYDGMSSGTHDFILSLWATGLVAEEKKVEGCCWVEQARAELGDAFRKSTCDAALFIDDSVYCVEGQSFLKAAVASNFNCVTQVYPKRKTKDLVVEFLEKTPALLHRTGPGIVEPIRHMQVRSTGLGCTFVRREPFLQTCEDGPQQKSIYDGRMIANPFHHMIGADGEFYGDDRAFFRRLRAGAVTFIDYTMVHDDMAVKLADVQGLFT